MTVRKLGGHLSDERQFLLIVWEEFIHDERPAATSNRDETVSNSASRNTSCRPLKKELGLDLENQGASIDLREDRDLGKPRLKRLKCALNRDCDPRSSAFTRIET